MLPGFENCGRKVGVIRRIREVLGFEAECKAAVIDLALLASNTVEEVPGVELEAWLCGRDFEYAARMRLIGLRG